MAWVREWPLEEKTSIQTTHRILSKETLLAFSIPTMVWYTKTSLDPPTAKCQWDNLCSSLLSLLLTGSIAVCIHCWIQTAACDGARCMLRVSWTMDNAHQKGLWVYVSVGIAVLFMIHNLTFNSVRNPCFSAKLHLGIALPAGWSILLRGLFDGTAGKPMLGQNRRGVCATLSCS